MHVVVCVIRITNKDHEQNKNTKSKQHNMNNNQQMIKKINLRRNKIGDEGAKYLNLPANLRALDLSCK